MLINEVKPNNLRPTKEMIDEIFNADPARRLHLCKKSEALFFIYYLGHYVKYPFANFHWDMFKDLDDLNNRTIQELGWFMHRESIKTSAAMSHIMHRICYEEKKFINVDSADQNNAEQLLFDITMELQTNPKIIEDFGHLYTQVISRDVKSRKKVNDFITTNNIRVTAYSTQIPVRGRKFGEDRPDELILDDFENFKTIKSKVATEDIKKHIQEFAGGLAPDYSVIYLGNYIAEYANIQDIIDRAKTSSSLRVRMVGVANEYLGPLHWPEKYVWTDAEAKEKNKLRRPDRPLVSLETKKAMMGNMFWGDMLNQPMNSDDAEFTRDMFHYVEMEEVMRMKPVSCNVILDPAGSKKKSADFTGVTIFWTDKENRRYLKSYQIKFDSKEILNHMFQIKSKYNPDKFYIEEGMYKLVIEPFLEDEMRRRNEYLIIAPVKHNATSKETRIRGLQPGLVTKTIWFIKGHTTDLEDQLLRFPNVAHDDVADSAAYVLTIETRPDTFEEEDFDYDELRVRKAPGN